MTPSSTTRSATRANLAKKGNMRRKLTALLACVLVVIGAAAVVVWAPWRTTAPADSVRYLGVYEADSPTSYAGVEQFAQAIGRQPNLVTYYSHWLYPFQTSFATSAEQHGATTLVQIAPQNIQLTDITAGRYDPYLTSYAAQVKAFGKPVILSFGHEMNGDWYSWGYKHNSPQVFIAAWRHIVTLFRAAGVTNVTWLWTVNIIGNDSPLTSDPASWWPGNSYVNMVGIDGYYYESTENFAQVFGPTIIDVRTFAHKPEIIAETGAAVAADQSAKINDLFSGIQTYGLLGFVWFDANDTTQGLNWRITSQAALSQYRHDANAFMKPAP
jgi:mannan endo-1,4-beta-mannosidase